MGYRFNDMPKDFPQRVFDVRNGATLKISFGCFYYRHHDAAYHDYIGWPSPDHPDMVHQRGLVDDPAPWMPDHHVFTQSELEPIHLAEEGYTNFSVVFDDPDIEADVVTDVGIDEVEDHVVRVKITVNLPTFTGKPKETGFTVFTSNEDDSIVDSVCHGIMKILPGGKRIGG